MIGNSFTMIENDCKANYLRKGNKITSRKCQKDSNQTSKIKKHIKQRIISTMREPIIKQT